SAASSRRRRSWRPLHQAKTPGSTTKAGRSARQLTDHQLRASGAVRSNFAEVAGCGAAAGRRQWAGQEARMATMYRYQLPVEQTGWTLSGETQTSFTWEYEDERSKLLALYDKGKKQQWDAAERIDWSLDLDPENPQELDDRMIPIFGTDIWKRMTEAERRQVRHHLQASQISQFMHGEQGALIATAKIVQTVPDIDSKFYAATQVMDEARHVEAYSRLLHDKFELAYPITHGLRSLLESGLS